MGAFLFAALAVTAVPARADDNSEFDFHIGDAFLTRLGAPPTDVARAAANGDTITVVGTGQFDIEEREASGQGTFEHRTADGTLFAFGTWKAKMLVSFDNFGAETGGRPDFIGGHAVISIRVTAHPASDPTVTLKFDAILVVDCEIGNNFLGVTEGITIDAGFINFNEKVSPSITLFVTEDAQD